MLSWLADAHLQECGNCQTKHSTDFSGLLGVEPATDRKHPLGCQARKKNAPRFYGVKAILTQRKRSGTGRSPSVDQTHLDNVETLLGSSHPTSPLIDNEPCAIQAADICKVSESSLLSQKLHKNRVDFNACYVL